MKYLNREHMTAAIYVSKISGAYYPIGTDKYWAKTTNGANIGQPSSGYNRAHAILIDARTS